MLTSIFLLSHLVVVDADLSNVDNHSAVELHKLDDDLKIIRVHDVQITRVHAELRNLKR